MRLFIKRVAFDGALYLANRVVAKFPSHKVRQWFYRRVLKLEIGRHSYIFMDAWFDARGQFRIGEHSVINQKCRMDNRGGLYIGTNVSISSEVCILTADHNIRSPHFEGREAGVNIHDYVFVGTRAMIMPGVTVGEGAVVAAGAVVTRDVAPYTIVAGVPAKLVGERPRQLEYTIDYGRLWW